MRKPRVGLHHNRAAGPREHALDERSHVGGSKRAVDAHHVSAQRAEGNGSHLRRGAQEGAAVLVEGHGDKYRKVRVLLCRQQGRLGLGDVGHGLDDEQVGASSVGGANLLGKQLVGFIERKRAHGFEQCAGGANVCRNVASARCAGAGDGSGEDLFDGGCISQLRAVCAKGVGGHNLRARLDVGGVYLGDLGGVGEAEQFGNLACGKAACLQLRAHGAVEQEEICACKDAREVFVARARRACCLMAKGSGGRLRWVIHGRSFRLCGWSRTQQVSIWNRTTRAPAGAWGVFLR